MSVKNGIKLLVVPPGGWTYEQLLDNGNSISISGATYEQLEDRVFEFRIHNTEAVPSGSATREVVQEDLAFSICTRAPNQCVGSPVSAHASRPDVQTAYQNPMARLDDWFKKLAASELEFIDPASAAHRAEICTHCPQNIGWRTGCAPCVESVERRLLRYKGSKATPSDGVLQFCRVYGHQNKLAVWLKDTASTPNKEIPAHCWKQAK